METLELAEVLNRFDESINSMADTFHNSPHNFAGLLFYHQSGGISLEPIYKRYPTPRPIQNSPRLGDLGVNKLTYAVSDTDQLYREYRDKVMFFGEPRTAKLPRLGEYVFVYGKDPDGNIIEFASWAEAKIEDGLFGGVRSIGISVTDLDRSKAWYQTHCDLDIVVAEHDHFSGLVDEVSGSSGTKVRSCLLDSSRRQDALLPTGMLELYEVSNPRGRSMPFGTEWGDYGYMEVCFLSPYNINELAIYYYDQGIDVVQRPTSFGEDEERTIQYWFMYVKDPDGNFVEIVGLHPIK